MDVRFFLVLVCFLLSGFAGLLYQTAWTRSFSFVFGTSNLAVATVLAAYMGGLSLGAALAARWLHRVRRPVLTYGLLELGVALSALAVPFAIRGSSALHVALFGGQPALPGEGGTASALFYLAAAFVILGVPTTLMGATLPMLARHAVREESQIGSRVGLLYAINTAGAIAGTLATAYLLLPRLGLRGTILAGATLNAAVFALAAILARGAGVAPPSAAAAHARRPGDAPAVRVLAIAFATSIASFTYEVLWTRLLEHVLGGSIFAFATMLASFLVGISLGGALASRLATTSARSVRGLAFAELGAGAFSIAAYLLIDRTPAWAGAVTLPGTGGALLRAAIGGALLLPSTLCIGATFPFLVRAFTSDPAAAGWASARVYAWNTLGAIVGSVSAGFWTIPLLSFSGAIAAAAGLSFALALLACTMAGRSQRALAGAALIGLGVLAFAPLPTPWKLLRTTPLFGLSASESAAAPPFYRVGRSATVILLEEDGAWRLRTNGLPESKIERRGAVAATAPIMRWMGALPALSRGAERVLVVGLGGGVVVEAVPPPIREVDVIELEEAVVEANRFVASERSVDPLSDPRVRVLVNDARGALALTSERWDGIVSQPSHPWTAGASHLYTREFFELVRARLAPGGIFVQWMGIGFVDRELLRTLVATMVDAFPHVHVYQPEPGGVLLVGSNDPLDFEARLTTLASAHRSAFTRAGLRVPEDLIAARVADEDEARALSRGARICTDGENALATRSPNLAAPTKNPMQELLESRGPAPVRLPPGLDSAYLARRLGEIGQKERGLRFAKALRGSERDVALGELWLATGDRTRALGHFERALAGDPTSGTARFRVVEGRRSRLLEGSAADAALATSLTGLAADVVEGWRLRERGEWPSLRALDGRLTSFDVRDPALRAALELRVDWRLAAGAPASATEAIELLDSGLVDLSGPVLARRAAAGVLAQRRDVTGWSLRSLLRAEGDLDARSSRFAREALASLPEGALSPAEREELARRLEGGGR